MKKEQHKISRVNTWKAVKKPCIVRLIVSGMSLIHYHILLTESYSVAQKPNYSHF